MLACAYGHYQLVEYFINVGMDINLHNANGCTALMISCVRGHVPIVQLLIRSGVEINAFNLVSCVVSRSLSSNHMIDKPYRCHCFIMVWLCLYYLRSPKL